MTSTSTSTRLTDLLVPTYKQNLMSLSAWLDKAADDAVLSKRLAPDMFPLATHVRFVCLQAQEAVYRLQHKEMPQALMDLGQEGRAFGADQQEDQTQGDTLTNAKERIQQALDFFVGLESDALDQNGSNSTDERKLTIELPNEMKFDMTREEYARDWALPQFYFHLVTAYAILRNAGVELGKADYVPQMFAYLQVPPPARPTTTTKDSQS